ncbi:MAG: carboxypeptidase regulatory-like domain-containing protein [Candidatus Sericytochromatia bacterium]
MFKRLFAAAVAMLLAASYSPSAHSVPFTQTGDYSDLRGRIYSLYFNGPLANATVAIPEYSTNVRTDANGYFEIRGLPTKWMTLEVRHATHQPLKRPIHIEPFGSKYVELYTDQAAQPAPPKVVFERNYDIWTSDMYGQNQISLTGQQPRSIYRTYPVWSRDKSQIGYIAFESSSKVSLDDDGVWIMRADGTMPRRMTSVVDVGRIYHLDWSADGNQFLFMLQDKMFVYNHRYGTQKNLSSALTRASAFDNYEAGPVWTPNADKIVTTAYSVDFSNNIRFTPNMRQIYMLDEQGGTRLQLTRDGDNYAPAVAHKGDRIAYVSTVSGNPEVWTMDLNGANPQQLTYLKATRMGQPRWSADDHALLFTSDYMQQYKSLQPKELWALDLDTRKVHMVTNDAVHADG